MNNETKDTRSGIKAYQESMRQETLRRIDDAYNYLIDTHQTVNRSSISRESGVSRVTLNNPAISEHLKKFPEFAPKQNRSDTKSIARAGNSKRGSEKSSKPFTSSSKRKSAYKARI